MEKLKLKFVGSSVLTEEDFQKYNGVRKINEAICQAHQDVRGNNFLSFFQQSLLPEYRKAIEEAFLLDYNINTQLKIETVSFNIRKLKSGRTPIPYSADTYEYEVGLLISSIEYYCIDIKENQQYVCYNDEDKMICYITTDMRAIVQ